MTIDRLVDLLEAPRRTARGWQARCPAHADKSPSLSIQEGDDGRILVYCFAGCTHQDICRAVGIQPKDLFADTPAQSHRQWQRTCQQRAVTRLVQSQTYERNGAAIDRVREAERLIQSARHIHDSAAWANDTMHEALNRLANAYEVLWHQEGWDYDSVGL